MPYTKKQKINIALFLAAIAIGITAVWYSNKLVKHLSQEERKKVQLWAKATFEMISSQGEISSTIVSIIESNETIPVILTDEDDNIISIRNFNPEKTNNIEYLKEQLKIMKEQNEPIEVEFLQGKKNYVYYKESVLLTQLFYYPFIQISVVALFIIASFLAVNTSKKAEENQLWVGMSKETAHQLGTPISSLIAWIELLKMKDEDPILIAEVEKDVERLKTITGRFSKIGSEPELVKNNISKLLIDSVDYLRARTSKKIEYILDFDKDKEIQIPMSKLLMEWVIENVCKNAIDAMEGKGKITISLTEKNDNVIIDISDTGKGIPKSKYNAVFKPGFTTKKRGWGLGLSLAKRIIEIGHFGKLFIKSSEIGKGTTFRIIMKKYILR